jgi:hypothetical protein
MSIRMRISTPVLLSIAILLIAPATASASGISAVINGKSYHVNSSYNWNEENLGLGVEYAFASASRWQKVLMANGFRDSENKMSYMTGAGLHRRLLETDRLSGLYVDAGVNAFIMTRQDINDNKPFPGILPSLTIGNRYAGFNITYLPKKAIESYMNANMNDPSLSGILFVQFKVNLDRFLPAN